MTKKIAALNDISGFGKCSLSAALPIISALGIQACPLPTAVLSNQTCYSTYFMKDLTEETKSIIDKWSEFKASFDGIYTGFISTEKQAETVLEFIDEFKSENTVFLSDPVMGDGGIIYPSFTTGLCEKIRLITSKADIVTPNITELGILAGMSADYVFKMPKDEKYLKNISKLAETLLKGKTKTIVVTGIAYKANEDKEDMFYNAVVTPKGTKFV